MLENIFESEKMHISFDRDNKFFKVILTHGNDDIQLFKPDF